MQGLRPIDVVLVPIAGWGPVLGPGHMGPGAAIDALRLIRPRVAIPIHWGSLVPLGLHRRSWGYLTQPPLDFLELARQHMPEVQVQILQPGESFAF
jgi:L-ascorbate metabolism protein UlaG (beta-lactamase superfamily)